MRAARSRILAALRTSLGRTEPLAGTQGAEMQAYVAQHACGPRPRSEWSPVARFRERALQLSSTVDSVESLDAVAAAVARYLAREALPSHAVIWPQLARLDWAGAGITVQARKAEAHDLVGITGSYCAIAETGTLVLLSSAATPASVSLLPETHIAIVACDRILRGMEEAWARIRTELGELPRAVNFVSGPSRTADIEQTLVLGAHGPYRVHVVLVGEAAQAPAS